MNFLFPLFLLSILISAACTSTSQKQSDQQNLTNTSPAITVDQKTQEQLEIKVEPAALSSVTAPIVATGLLELNENQTWQVGALIAGKIMSVPVHRGDFVRAGQIIAQMHSHEVYDSRATRRQYVAELDRLKTLEEQALRIRDRTQRLLELKAASREQMEAAETAYRSAQLSVANAQAEVEKANFHLKNFLEVPIEESSRSSGSASEQDRIPIKSPASGTVMERLANNGSVVSAGDPVIIVSDLSTLWLIAAVNEEDLSRIFPGQSVSVSVRAYPDRTFMGKVHQLGERMDPQTRTLQIRVSVANTKGLLKPDMFVTAEFAPQQTEESIYLPESAIQQIDGKAMVFIRSADGKYEPHPVEVGKRADQKVEILSGIDLGTSVVVQGAFLLKSHLLKSDQD